MRREKIRMYDLVLAALLVGIGLVLHAVFPGILGGMRPDFSLVMLFVVLLLIPDKRVGFITGIATGIVTALTTTFPMGEIANIVDKLVTTFAVLGLVKLLPRKVLVPVTGIIGTLVSGTTFLTTAAVIAGLPESFTALLTGVVIPATIINTVALILLYPVASELYSMQRFSSLVKNTNK